MAVLSKLPADVLDQILVCVPDFGTLKAFTESCRAVRRAYTRHAAQIRRTVAHNVCGPDWTLALRAVCVRRARDAAEAGVKAGREERRLEMVDMGMIDADKPDPWDSEDGQWSDDWSEPDSIPRLWLSPVFPDVGEILLADISTSDAEAMDAMGPRAALIERAFSQRFHDAACNYSLLSPDESRRFHRALYIHEIFITAYGVRRRDFFPLRDDKRRKRDMTRFLTAYSTQELGELQDADLFIQDVAESATHVEQASDLVGAAPQTPSASSLSLAMTVRLLETPESRNVGRWPTCGERIGALLCGIGKKRGLGDDWPHKSVSATFGPPSNNPGDLVSSPSHEGTSCAGAESSL